VTQTRKSAAPQGRNIPNRSSSRKFGSKGSFPKQSNSSYARRFKDHETSFQFVIEPIDASGESQWFTYQTHYHPVAWALPCDGTAECQGCQSPDPDFSKTSRKVLVQLMANRKVEVYSLPPSLLKPLQRIYSRYGTLLGKVFTVFKDGEGLGTRYEIEVAHDLPVSPFPDAFVPAEDDVFEKLVENEYRSALDKLGIKPDIEEDEDSVPF
jgi:hypothetical protein